MRRPRGITLVELVLVIVLTLILASVAVGGLKGVRAWRAAATVRRVHADLAHARNLAMLSARRTLCVFDPSGRSYEIRQEAAPSQGKLGGPVIAHPLTGQPWSVALGDWAVGLRIKTTAGLPQGGLGFGKDGMPLSPTGKALRRDVRLSFTNGADIVIRAGSGRAEVLWP